MPENAGLFNNKQKTLGNKNVDLEKDAVNIMIMRVTTKC